MVDENNQVFQFNVGDVLTGKVVKIEEKQALVDVGYKVDAILPISEVSNLHIEKITDVLQEGETIQVKVKKFIDEEEELVVSKRAVDAELAWERLESIYRNGEVLEGRVADVVKGGLVVDLGVRGFVPASQVELHYVEDFSDYKGQTLRFKIIELDRENNRVILSRRAVLESEQEQKVKEFLQGLKEGQILEGTVQRLTQFGAFVDVGGVDGLVHISELSWEHIQHPGDVVKVGDRVQVKVLRVDPDNERLSLSLKATQPSPWDQAAEKIVVGSIMKGTVKRLAPFGAFVEIYPGVEGLVHISQISNRHIGTPGEVLKEGQEVEVKVLDVNLGEKRISLSIKEAEEEKNKPANLNVKLEPEEKGFTIAELIDEEIRKKLQ